ncbi:hypothetical protein NIES3974_34430 [Calothrix sp. NIES-3974]|nr:hypothetical protein NIES3974_34430 [Calothrix sp. NIES-3974]
MDSQSKIRLGKFGGRINLPRSLPESAKSAGDTPRRTLSAENLLGNFSSPNFRKIQNRTIFSNDRNTFNFH